MIAGIHHRLFKTLGPATIFDDVYCLFRCSLNLFSCFLFSLLRKVAYFFSSTVLLVSWRLLALKFVLSQSDTRCCHRTVFSRSFAVHPSFRSKRSLPTSHLFSIASFADILLLLQTHIPLQCIHPPTRTILSQIWRGECYGMTHSPVVRPDSYE